MKKVWLFIVIGEILSFGVDVIASKISVNTGNWPQWMVTSRNFWFFPFNRVLAMMYGPNANDLTMTGFYCTLLCYTVVVGVVIAVLLHVLFRGLLALTGGV